MPTVAQIIKFRQSRHLKELRSPWARLGLASGLCASLLLVAAVIAGTGYYLNIIRDLPSIDTLPALLEPPSGALLQPTRFYDRSGQHAILTLQNPAADGWRYLQVTTASSAGENQVSQNLIKATLSVLDPGFWNEPGYTFRGIAESTHPTLAQRLVLNLLLADEPASWRRNLRERLLAMQVTAQFGRALVLEWYLNSAQYGEFVYGADAAARVYLGKSATQLTIAQAALLTAIAQSPDISPWNDRQLIRDRQVQIIQDMQKNGWINAGEAQAALKEYVQIQPKQEIASLSPALTNLALMQLRSKIPVEAMWRGGYNVITTLDYDLQGQVACTAQAQINRLQGILPSTPADDGTTCSAAQLLPGFPADSQKPGERPSADIIVQDPETGEVLAWVGETAADPTQALPADHPSATILSPFLYLTAFSRGMSPATLVWDDPTSGDLDLSDESMASFHGPVRIRLAMGNDYLGAAVDVLQQVGIDNVWATETKFGLIAGDARSPSKITLRDLFSQPISLLDTVQAYSVLANQGVMAGQLVDNAISGDNHGGLSPTTILRVESLDGQVRVDGSETFLRPIVNNQLAFLTTDVLSDEKARSIHLGDPDPLDIGRPVAVKTSISSDGADAWTVGYTPQRTVGVWMGLSGEKTGKLTAEMAADLWHAVTAYTTNTLPIQEFAMPDGIHRMQVCDPSGLLVSPACPSAVVELFIKGNEPTQMDDLYKNFLIDRQTGLLATIFTPPELVEQKVFLVPPSEHADWLKTTGISTPPVAYDEIHTQPQASVEAQITHPGMLEYVSGKVELIGSAMGEGFSYYRLEVGQGLNPQRWLQIGGDVSQPVQESNLGTCDTTGDEGPYVVELLVVRQDLSIERAFLPLMVDNMPPQVQILAPNENDQLSYPPGGMIVLQVQANDALGIERVEFYIDQSLASTLYEPPYITPWQAQTGEHSLQIKAYDLAGNQAQAQISFTISK